MEFFALTTMASAPKSLSHSRGTHIEAPRSVSGITKLKDVVPGSVEIATVPTDLMNHHKGLQKSGPQGVGDVIRLQGETETLFLNANELRQLRETQFSHVSGAIEAFTRSWAK